jgi:AraC family transcriptional regulator
MGIMTSFEEIQEALKYIENNLSEPLDINALAAKVHLSPYYFQRLFSRLVGRPIADYLKQRRIARSLQLLCDKNERILDIALKLGFNNHETFTRAFKTSFGITPEEYRCGRRIKSNEVLVPDVTLGYKLVDEDVPLVSDGIVLEITRRTYTQERLYAGFQAADPGRAWDYLTSRQMRGLPFLHPQGEHIGIGIKADGGYEYLVGCQVTARDPGFLNVRGWPGADDAPDYLKNAYASLPPGEYLVCTYTAEDFSRLVVEAMSRVIPYFFSTFIKKHGLEVCGPLIEVYDGRSLRWHPSYRVEDDAPHLEPREPKLSGWEGPEMEIQVMIKG